VGMPPTLTAYLGCPSGHPINSIKALKAKFKKNSNKQINQTKHTNNNISKLSWRLLIEQIRHEPTRAFKASVNSNKTSFVK